MSVERYTGNVVKSKIILWWFNILDHFLSPWIQIWRIRIQRTPESGSKTLKKNLGINTVINNKYRIRQECTAHPSLKHLPLQRCHWPKFASQLIFLVYTSLEFSWQQSLPMVGSQGHPISYHVSIIIILRIRLVGTGSLVGELHGDGPGPDLVPDDSGHQLLPSQAQGNTASHWHHFPHGCGCSTTVFQMCPHRYLCHLCFGSKPSSGSTWFRLGGGYKNCDKW